MSQFHLKSALPVLVLSLIVIPSANAAESLAKINVPAKGQVLEASFDYDKLQWPSFLKFLNEQDGSD